MSKIIIDDLLDETSFLNDANLRFKQVQDEFNEKVLYRTNPIGEPNGMFNDLDMQENDVLNVGQLDVNTLIVAGIPFDGAVNWGQIGGTLSDQKDLQDELDRIEASNVNSLTIGSDTLLDKGLEATRDEEGNIVLEYTDRVNSAAFGMVRLNSQGKVPLSLLDLKPIEVIGFFYGDNTCPKPIDLAGEPGLPVTLCPGTPNDFRNPDEIFGEIFETGHTFVLNFQTGTIGDINLVDPDNLKPGDALLVQEVNSGDAIVYIEEIVLGGTPISRKGWRLWKDAVVLNTAAGVSYNSAGDLVIDDPDSDNVNLALKDLDKEADLARTHRTATGNAHNATPGDIGAEPANPLIKAHIDPLANGLPVEGNPHNTTVSETGGDTSGEVDQKIIDAIAALELVYVEKTDYASSTAYGVITTKYDPNTNTLFIRDDGALTP